MYSFRFFAKISLIYCLAHPFLIPVFRHGPIIVKNLLKNTAYTPKNENIKFHTFNSVLICKKISAAIFANFAL
jgi:hypothetical protein